MNIEKLNEIIKRFKNKPSGKIDVVNLSGNEDNDHLPPQILELLD